jgi:hypothetical protein
MYLDRRRNVFVDPFLGWSRVKTISVPQFDLTYLWLTVIDANRLDDVRLNADGTLIASASNVILDLSDQVDGIVGIKAEDHTNATDYEEQFEGFTSDSRHSPANARLTRGIILSSAVAPGTHWLEWQLLTALGNKWTLPKLKLTCEQVVNVGTETNAPSGVPGGQRGSFSISDDDESATVSVTGLTADGFVLVSQTAPTGNIAPATYQVVEGTDEFVVTVQSSPGTGNAFNFKWELVRLDD